MKISRYALPSATAAAGLAARSARAAEPTAPKRPADFDPDLRAAHGRQRDLPSCAVVVLRAGVDFGRFSIEAHARSLGDAHDGTSVGAVGHVPGGAIRTGVIRPRGSGLTLGAGF